MNAPNSPTLEDLDPARIEAAAVAPSTSVPGTSAWNRLNAKTKQYAHQLRQALACALELHASGRWGRPEIEAAGRRDYERVFGHAISVRHFWRLFDQVIARDGDKRDFGKLALYLPGHPVRKTRPEEFDRLAKDLPSLEDAIKSVTDLDAPTNAEMLLVWIHAMEEYERLAASGISARKAARRVIGLLHTSGLPLAITRSALSHTFARKLARWIKGGRMPSSIEDRRRRRSGEGRPLPFTPEDIATVVRRVNRVGVSKAYRDTRRDGLLSQRLTEHYTDHPSNKSYTPKRFRAIVTQRAHLIKEIELGPRNAVLKGACIHRNWDHTEQETGSLFQSDDCTADVYFWDTDADGSIRVIRGQFLPIIDVRTTRILAFALHRERNYTAKIIRTLIVRAHDEFGLPRKGFYFERGIWKSAKLLTGVRDPVPRDDLEIGLREWCQFQHAKLPRAKIIERCLRALQAEMTFIPGFCGRDEMHVRYERNERNKKLVESGKMHPSEGFLHFGQWNTKLREICEQYNDERHDRSARMLPGIAPREAWEAWFDHDRPLMRLEPSVRFLLANHRKPCPVTRQGVWAKVEGRTHWFRSEQLGEHVGQEVQMYYEPDDLSSCWVLLSRNDRKAIVIPHEPDCPALSASPEQLHAAQASCQAMNRPAKTYYTAIQPHLPDGAGTPVRRVIADPETVEMGREIAEAQAEIRKQQKTDTSTRHQLARYQRRFGVTRDQEAIPESQLLEGYRWMEEAQRNVQHTPSEP